MVAAICAFCGEQNALENVSQKNKWPIYEVLYSKPTSQAYGKSNYAVACSRAVGAIIIIQYSHNPLYKSFTVNGIHLFCVQITLQTTKCLFTFDELAHTKVTRHIYLYWSYRRYYCIGQCPWLYKQQK